MIFLHDMFVLKSTIDAKHCDRLYILFIIARTVELIILNDKNMNGENSLVS